MKKIILILIIAILIATMVTMNVEAKRCPPHNKHCAQPVLRYSIQVISTPQYYRCLALQCQQGAGTSGDESGYSGER